MSGDDEDALLTSVDSGDEAVAASPKTGKRFNTLGRLRGRGSSSLLTAVKEEGSEPGAPVAVTLEQAKEELTSPAKKRKISILGLLRRTGGSGSEVGENKSTGSSSETKERSLSKTGDNRASRKTAHRLKSAPEAQLVQPNRKAEPVTEEKEEEKEGDEEEEEEREKEEEKKEEAEEVEEKEEISPVPPSVQSPEEEQVTDSMAAKPAKKKQRSKSSADVSVISASAVSDFKRRGTVQDSTFIAESSDTVIEAKEASVASEEVGLDTGVDPEPSTRAAEQSPASMTEEKDVTVEEKQEEEKDEEKKEEAGALDGDDGRDYGESVFLLPEFSRIVVYSGQDHPYQVQYATLYKLVEKVTTPSRKQAEECESPVVLLHLSLLTTDRPRVHASVFHDLSLILGGTQSF
jgi:hypothetical protein